MICCNSCIIDRFMICCDSCENWYHGSCVGITKAKGKEMDKNNEEYMCPPCKGQQPVFIVLTCSPRVKVSNQCSLFLHVPPV